jgi:adenylate cyclase
VLVYAYDMSSDPYQDGNVAALNADVVGYSRLLADDFDATSAAMTAVRTIVEIGIGTRGGRLVNFVGDNFMAVFDSTRNGVQAAIEISRAVEEVNADLPQARWLRFRMGMDRGQVSQSDGHFEGDALNIAARVQVLAQSGGLSVSQPIYLDLDEPALRFRSTGYHRLKNIPEPVEVFEFVDLPSDGITTDRASSLSLDAPTVAVLPIIAEGVDDTVQAGAGVMRADILHRLAAIPELTVIEATATGGQAGTAARYMLETGVHQFGDTLRAYATLFDVTTMNVVKSHKITGPTSDVLNMSDRLSEDVGTSIEVELVVGAPAGLYAELDDPEAIEKVYLGWYNLRSDTVQGWQRALSLFGEVADSHPDIPYGWVLSAFANWIGASNEWATDSQEALLLAREQAKRGLDVGDPTGLAQTVDAAVLMSLGRIDEAIAKMESVEIIRPTCDVTFGLEGSLKRYLGEWEEAVDKLDVAMRLTGVNKPWYPTVKACSLFMGHRNEQAVSVAESVLEYQPNNLEALLVLAAAQVELGLDRRSQATATEIRDRFPTVDISAWLDRNPYQDESTVARWKADLAALALIPAP